MGGEGEAVETGAEVRVREEDGLAFQYPERILGRALDGWSPRSYMRPGDGRIKGRRGERDEGEREGVSSAAL